MNGYKDKYNKDGQKNNQCRDGQKKKHNVRMELNIDRIKIRLKIDSDEGMDRKIYKGKMDKNIDREKDVNICSCCITLANEYKFP